MHALVRRSFVNFHNLRHYCSSSSPSPPHELTRLERELCQMIRFSGPIPIAQYMREVLSNPVSGYYAAHNRTDTYTSDFITSPEVSQMFGECLGVWLLNEWAKMGTPRPLQLVEFGPGTGLLMKDILRTFETLLRTKHLSDILSLHLVEISPNLRKVQRVQLSDPKSPKTTKTPSGVPIHWHRSLDTVPRGFSMFIAHEYLDALPIHQFVKNEDNEWREVLIDVSPENDDQLRFIKARNKTPAISYLSENESRDAIEVCSDARTFAKDLSNRVAEDGGMGLIIDYGHNGDKELTLRAFKKHTLLENALQLPGLADVTADVDFRQLKEYCCKEKTITFGPVRQSEVLEALGIRIRMEKLASSSNEKAASIIEENYKTLTDSDKMGDKFKFFSIFPRTMEEILRQYPPVGFQFNSE
ncbi:protein arginine methyltransferase NDUFAF7, mitochondrial [Lepeophtheirus salmonis]|uniref:Protein arginine methyltransferase NDUFAF7 n=1 Tax=Lepeophtheirus salmonis TaxID=72036 RepID=A0A0K2T3F7_LEPSM|nr:protein arginine methyltransferase NDUFAF7, mitochondrial-like [Lepeophtheirus salmonis]